jgi:Crp-like helix-turn-helix domain
VWEVEMTGHISAELLGAGDVIYPWETGGFSAPSKGVWRVIVPARTALLDERLFARIAPWPALAGTIASRSTRRGRLLAALALTRRMRRIDDRLVFVFALFAERWGKVGPDGVRLSLPVTHELLGRVVGARRQSVTTALSDLRERGVITALSHGQWPARRSSGPRRTVGLRKNYHRSRTKAAMSAGEEYLQVLDVDHELASALPAEQLQDACAATRARVLKLQVGGWDATGEYGERTSWLGLLILDGFVARETSCQEETAIEVIGPGDLLRPGTTTVSIRWRASLHIGGCWSRRGSRCSTTSSHSGSRRGPR